MAIDIQGRPRPKPDCRANGVSASRTPKCLSKFTRWKCCRDCRKSMDSGFVRETSVIKREKER
jgi:hypothetical protein